MGDERESEKPAEPVIEALLRESMHARLKRISQVPRKEGEPRFVRGYKLGPITFAALPPTPDDDAGADEKHCIEGE